MPATANALDRLKALPTDFMDQMLERYQAEVGPMLDPAERARIAGEITKLEATLAPPASLVKEREAAREALEDAKRLVHEKREALQKVEQALAARVASRNGAIDRLKNQLRDHTPPEVVEFGRWADAMHEKTRRTRTEEEGAWKRTIEGTKLYVATASSLPSQLRRLDHLRTCQRVAREVLPFLPTLEEIARRIAELKAELPPIVLEPMK